MNTIYINGINRQSEKAYPIQDLLDQIAALSDWSDKTEYEGFEAYEVLTSIAEELGLDPNQYETYDDLDNAVQDLVYEKFVEDIKAHSKTGELIRISTMSGKLDGFHSISTSVLLNPRCQARQKCADNICSKCYASATIQRHTNLDKVLEQNTKALSTRVLKARDLPHINDRYFRLEAFGDLNNEIQFINYIKLCEKNPETNFALWTKNYDIVESVLKFMDKPENLIIVMSSTRINKKEDLALFPHADKIFTVYDLDGIHEQNIKINCGGTSCKDCMLCYTKNSVTEINELLKSDQQKLKRMQKRASK